MSSVPFETYRVVPVTHWIVAYTELPHYISKHNILQQHGVCAIIYDTVLSVSLTMFEALQDNTLYTAGV